MNPSKRRWMALHLGPDLLPRLAIGLTLLGASILLLATSPVGGDFWWSDAPRHALNGVFVRDFVLAHPFADPIAWAFDYYDHRPSLTILFYPPFFYAIEAIAFALFGVGHFVAQACIAAFVLLLAGASYNLARVYMPRWHALAAALLTISTPAAALWGRQVMLDVPAYALLVTSACFLMHHCRSRRPASLYAAGLFFLLAVYTKYNAALFAPAFLVTFLAVRGVGAMRERHTLAVAALAAVGLAPAVFLTLKFGSSNVAAVSGLAGTLPLTSAAAWLFYVRVLPEQLGYIVTILGGMGVAVMVTRLRGGDATYTLPIAWLLIGYLAPTLISVREPRHTLMSLLPLVLGLPLLLRATLPTRLGQAASLDIALAVGVHTLATDPVPIVRGYAGVARYLDQHLTKSGVVLYSGYRDGNLVFDIAALNRPDIAVVRADKLLLAVPAGERRRGVEQKSVDAEQIAEMIRRIGPDYLVIQPGFWADLADMRLLQKILAGPEYERVAHFSLTGTLSTSDGTDGLDILKPKIPPTDHHLPSSFNFAIIGHKFHQPPDANAQ